MGVFSMFKPSVSKPATSEPSVTNSNGNTQAITVAQPVPKKLPFGGKPHVITDEERARGQETRRRNKQLREEQAAREALIAEAAIIAERARNAAELKAKELKRAEAKKEWDARPVNPETGHKYFTNTIQATFKYYKGVYNSSFPCELTEINCDPIKWANTLATKLSGLVMIPGVVEGADWIVILEHRESKIQIAFASVNGELEVATSKEATPKLLSDLQMLTALV